MAISIYEIDHNEKGPMSAERDAHLRRKARVEELSRRKSLRMMGEEPEGEGYLEYLLEGIVEFLDEEVNTQHYR